MCKYYNKPFNYLSISNRFQLDASENQYSTTQPRHTISSSSNVVSLKHRRYKPLHNVTSSPSSQPRSSVQASSISASSSIESPLIDHLHNHHAGFLPHPKSSRSGFQVQKTPPDLQFGLAFTVPFVSLSTDKLLHTVAGKNFDSVSSLLKLNMSGLLLAAVVGLAAAAGIFLPGILGGAHGLGPLGSSQPWLDGIIPQFTDNLYNDYGAGWDSGNNGGINNNNNRPWGKDFNGGKEFGDRRNGRNSGDQSGSAGSRIESMVAGALSRVVGKLREGVTVVERCVIQRVCEEQKTGGGRLSELVREFKDNDLVKEVGVVKVLRGIVVDTDASGVCGKLADPGAGKDTDHCHHVASVEQTLTALLRGWGGAPERKGTSSAEQRKGGHDTR